MKEVSRAYETSKKLEEVLDEYCDAVGSTMGPGGRTVIISNGGIPHVTKDGVTVSESIHFEDPYKEDIASLIKEAARKTATDVGDGTTTSTVLAANFITFMGTAINHTKLTRKEFLDKMGESVEYLVEYLDDMKTEVEKDSPILESIVKISCNGDQEIIDLIMEASNIAGADGIIDIEQTELPTSFVESSGGTLIESRAHVEKVTELENPFIVLNEGRIDRPGQIKPLFVASSRFKRPVILIAKEFTDDVIRVAAVNRARGGAEVYLVEAEGFGETRLAILGILNHITGATVFSTDGSTVNDFKNVDIINSVPKAIIKKNETILFPEEEIKKTFESAVTKLKAYMKKPGLTAGELSNLKRQLTKYSSTAIIKVGGATIAEAIERKDRVDDAVRAAAAAVTGGVVPGGGVALYNAYMLVKKKGVHADIDDVLFDVCITPFVTLTNNLGISFDITDLETDYNVLNLYTGEVEDAYEAGILDPALVTINAVKNAFSVAKTIVNSNFYILPQRGLQSEGSYDY